MADLGHRSVSRRTILKGGAAVAALGGDCQHARWFLALARSLLIPRPDVLDAFAGVPAASPRFLRSTVWQVGFAEGDPGWTFNSPRPFCPVLTLDAEGRLTRASTRAP